MFHASQKKFRINFLLIFLWQNLSPANQRMIVVISRRSSGISQGVTTLHNVFYALNINRAQIYQNVERSF